MFNFVPNPRRQALTVSPIGAVMVAGVLLAGAGSAARAVEPVATPTAQVRFDADRKACLGGQSPEGRVTCLKEAGAALAAARSGGLTAESDLQLARNALMHCHMLPADDQANCRTLDARSAATLGVAGDDEGVRELVTEQPSN